MSSSCPSPRGNTQRGVALLIAIFSLVLISAVAISLIVMSGTESAINANYRRSTTAFYAAQAGLEEARERLLVNAPDTVRANPAFPNANPPNVITGQALYILNPAPGDPPFNPQTDPPTSPYYDNEYQQEFGVAPAPNPLLNQVTNSSAMTTAGNLPPLPYKWVRITLKSEAMGGVDLNGDGILDPATPLLAQASNNQCLPTMPNCSTNPNLVPITSTPVYRLTAMALEPNGGKRMLQAEVTEMPIVNPVGAIASQAAVNLNGNFGAFGSWPPIVNASCGSGAKATTIPTCGSYVKGKVVGDCTNPYDPVTDTCNGLPRSHNDYCNAATAVDSVASAGTITAGASYSQVPDQSSACATTGPGCIFTSSPQKALDPNVPWPYDMSQVIAALQPPVTEPVTDFAGISCGTFDIYGNRICQGSGVQMGTLPSTWPPPPGATQLDNQPRYVFADVGRGGLLKLTGASSGSGLLVVDGDLQLNGGFQWYGLILVRGVVTFLGGGSTGTNVFGGVIAGRDVTNANTVTGGSVSIIYSSCAYRFNNQNQALRYLTFREITCRTGQNGVQTCQ